MLLLVRNTRLILALAIRIGVPVAVVNKHREVSLLVPEKTSRRMAWKAI